MAKKDGYIKLSDLNAWFKEEISVAEQAKECYEPWEDDWQDFDTDIYVLKQIHSELIELAQDKK